MTQVDKATAEWLSKALALMDAADDGRRVRKLAADPKNAAFLAAAAANLRCGADVLDATAARLQAAASAARPVQDLPKTA